ncbi:hypothetical protein [Rhodococcus sp. (in: high G+C Gram-positive bacteria)]|uniref:hypothetical protein n=1 Tax=Rhodococcus sp. TaxID=1831 RepID=UPI003B8A6CD8
MTYEPRFSPTAPDCWDEVYPPTPALGHLYVIEFDSGWMKVGYTTNWPRRRTAHAATFRRMGWTITRPPWVSCVVPAAALRPLEERLLAEAQRTCDGRRFNPARPRQGRDRSRPAGTELFHDCSFGYLSAFGDVLARTDAYR